MPDPDLVIRTSGEHRISNFLLWELAYSELVFTDVLWPDFRREHLFDAVREFQRRDRRFGGLEGLRWEPMSLYRDHGIVLRTYKLGEADRIVVFVTGGTARSGPSPRACARPRAASAARLEPLTHVALQLYEGRELDIVTQAETIDHFRALRDDLDRLPAASTCSRPSTRWPRSGSRTPALPDAARRAADAARPTRAAGRGRVLLEAAGRRGLPPGGGGCVRVRRRPSLVAFDLDEGGVLCRTCRRGVPISADALELLRRVLGGDLAAALREPPTAATHEVDTLAAAALEHHLERRLRAVGMLGQV